MIRIKYLFVYLTGIEFHFQRFGRQRINYAKHFAQNYISRRLAIH
jgi:hypothetical protein